MSILSVLGKAKTTDKLSYSDIKRKNVKREMDYSDLSFFPKIQANINSFTLNLLCSVTGLLTSNNLFNWFYSRH